MMAALKDGQGRLADIVQALVGQEEKNPGLRDLCRSTYMPLKKPYR